MIRFFEQCVPPTTTPQGRRHTKTGHSFKPKAQVQAESTYDSLFMPHRPESPMAGALSVVLTLWWPYTMGDLKTKALRDRIDEIPHTGKPDCDNLSKMILDSLARLRFIENDAHIVHLSVRKCRARVPGIAVIIESYRARPLI